MRPSFQEGKCKKASEYEKNAATAGRLWKSRDESRTSSREDRRWIGRDGATAERAKRARSSEAPLTVPASAKGFTQWPQVSVTAARAPAKAQAGANRERKAGITDGRDVLLAEKVLSLRVDVKPVEYPNWWDSIWLLVTDNGGQKSAKVVHCHCQVVFKNGAAARFWLNTRRTGGSLGTGHIDEPIYDLRDDHPQPITKPTSGTG